MNEMARSRNFAVVDRRTVIASSLCLLGTKILSDERAQPLLDIHVHLFGVGDAGTGCRMSKAITDGLQFKVLAQVLGLRAKSGTMDEAFERVLTEQVRGSGMTKAAILGQDAVYDRQGQPDWHRTAVFVPNDYVAAVVERHSDTMIACPSINPDRADALRELQRCYDQGARLVKIHPPTQGVDVADPKHKPFFRLCAELKMVTLVHTGHEHSAPVISKDLAAPRRLELALDQGCTIVACHAGTGWETDSPDQLPEFFALLNRYPNLWGDTAVLGSSGRVRDFIRLLDHPKARDRLLHGSDFPFPIAPIAFVPRIQEEKARDIDRNTNWLKKDFELKDALGIGRASAQRGYELYRAAGR